jgi:glycine/D-amino acid oxidase-like deaminating enzyme
VRDVAIIGGGIAGVSLADHLARAGADVVLLERGELNREASGTNAGSMHLQIAIHQFIKGIDDPGEAERLQEETRLAAEAAELWKAMDDELGLDFHVTGGLMVAETSEQLQLLRDKQPLERAAGLETHVLEGAELRSFAPYLSERVIGATYCPAEGHVNPLIAVDRLARRSGAEIVTHAEVTAIEPGFRVLTNRGVYEAQRVVNAAGAWAPRFQPLPMRAMGLHVNVTEPRGRLIEPMIQHIGRRLTLKQAYNGTFIIGGGWPSREAPGRWATTWESTAGNAAVAVDVVPALADVRLLRTWSGVIAWTDDVSPLLGESDVPGLYTIVVGSSGYTLSPLFARMLAEQIVGGAPLPLAYSPERRTPA